MEPNRALDDLKAIRDIMDRTQKASGGESGWFLVVGGLNWVVGFMGQQFLPQRLAGWLWVVSNVITVAAIIWLGVRSSSTNSVSSPLWRPILAMPGTILLFDLAVIWLFELQELEQIILIVVLSFALGFLQLGLFFSPLIATVGALLGVLAVAAYALIPGLFFAAIGLLGGGLMIYGGALMIRSGRSAGQEGA